MPLFTEMDGARILKFKKPEEVIEIESNHRMLIVIKCDILRYFISYL